ncbi:MAG: FG-GAP repeat domain-containing protein [Ardenticatenaceae bacterium]
MQNQRTYLRLLRQVGRLLLPALVAMLSVAFLWPDVGATDAPLEFEKPLSSSPNPAVRLSESVGIEITVPLEQEPSWLSNDNQTSHSVAWGDVDGDGDLDLAAGNQNQPNALYLNEGGRLSLTPSWQSNDSDDTESVAWGDVDADGDLDLAVGNYGQPNKLYLNEGGTLSQSASWQSNDNNSTMSVAWGDVDADGDLDLAVGNRDYQKNKLYLNEEGTLTESAVWESNAADRTYTLAWGDVDADGDLDLVVGNRNQKNRLYLNENGMLEMSPSWQSNNIHYTVSLAWADVDGDGDLDLAVGDRRSSNKLYLNVDGMLTASPSWQSNDNDRTFSVAWGDVDADGDLDLIAGNWDKNNKLYLNESGTLSQSASWQSQESDRTFSVAWGDVDADGDLDLMAGNSVEPNKLHLNESGMLTVSPRWQSNENDPTRSVAWGDVDADGDLDLAVGNQNQPNKLYLNENGMLASSASWESNDSDETENVAWGDVDGDGDLDLAVGNATQPNRLYLNEGGMLNSTASWQSEESQGGAVAWGDIDADGDLDLAVANGNWISGPPNKLYLNEGGMLSVSASWQSNENDPTVSVAWGDVDGDGDLDLAVANGAQPNKLYLNEGGMLTVSANWQSSDSENTRSMAWGDVDGDGDLDLAVVNEQKPHKLYLNKEGVLTSSASWRSNNSDRVTSMAWGDVDGDGDLDLAVGHPENRNKLYLNQRPAHPLHLNQGPAIQISTPHAPANFYALPEIQEGVIPITYTLSHPAGAPMGKVQAFYSPDGGGRWFEALATSDTITSNLVSKGEQHVYHWDVLASGFFGQSDNVVFRLEALPNLKPITGTIAGPFQRPLVSTQTYSFRVRGSQVRVLSGTLPVEGGLLYRLPAGQTTGGELIADHASQPFRTDGQGYLQGRGELAIGDTLIALLPITTTESYTLYHTSATPTETGLEGHVLQQPGVQELVVSADNPLLLFDLDLSLEWDARNDGTFLTNLEGAIKSASDLLYDVSNGQVAIGEVRVHQGKENWLASNIVMYAANNIRPRANMGGIVSSSTHDFGLTGPILNAYLPGQVRMGPNWDPFGETHSDLGQDWWRALAHELAHYLLYLPDNYVGISPNGNLIALDCQGSFMTSTYDDDYSEFLTSQDWVGDCQKSIAAQTTGRTDWETISKFYPMINHRGGNPGPSILPLGVTQVTSVEPLTDTINTTTLPARYFDLRDAQDSALLPLPQAVGYLFKTQGTSDLTDDTLIALGATGANGDRVKVRGAEAGDRICVFDNSSHHVGCETVTELNVSVSLSEVPDWQPFISVTPVSSRTFAITVTQLIESGDLNVQLLPAYGSAVTPTLISAPWEQMIPLDPANPLTFTQVITLPYPAFEGSVRVWVPDSTPEREAISQFYLSAAWGPRDRGSDGNLRAWEANARAWSGNTRAWGAPVASGDGQVTIFNTIDPFGETGTSALQALTTLPNLPAWLTPVGQGYQVSLLDSTILRRTISFDYLQRDVPPGYEQTLSIYHLPHGGQSWQRLATDLDSEENQAASLMPLDAAGIYALFSTVEIALPTAGWNHFGYPVQATLPVTEALLSISGHYTTVYHYDGSASPQWTVYDVTAPAYVNDLQELSYAQAYWINTSQPITLSLYVGTAEEERHALNPSFAPPATYYGLIEPDLIEGELPADAGAVVTAWIDGQLCGQGKTQLEPSTGQMVYTVHVWSEAQKAACGAAGRRISFQIGSQQLATTARWHNSQLWELPLERSFKLYLPLVR